MTRPRSNWTRPLLRRVVVVAGLCWSWPALAQAPGAPTYPPVVSLELRDAPLRSALDAWSRVSGRPLTVVWASLQREGVDPEARVSIRVAGASPEAVLRLLLDQAEDASAVSAAPETVRSAGGPVRLIAEPGPEGGYELLTRSMANRRTEVRVYPLGELTARAPNFPGPRLGLDAGGGEGAGGLDFSADTRDDEDDGDAARRPGDDVADLIRTAVEPELWRANGGTVASVSVYRNLLVVRAPAYVHRKIGWGQPTLTPERRAVADTASNEAAGPSRAGEARRDRREPTRQSPGGVSGVRDEGGAPVGAAR
ncbi:MAG: hypothetical protein AAF612_03335 [Planctomycetota bacterium]